MAEGSRSTQDFADDAVVYLSRALNKGWSKPDWVSVNLTLKCNLACTFCKTCYPVRHELTTREIKDIIDQTFSWGVKRFNPIGGEPFVRPDLEEILAYACAKDFTITLTTNGTLISPKRAAEIAKIPHNRLHFNFSIDGFNPWHDMGRGEGMFDKCVEGLRNIREADRAAGNPLRTIYINGIINALNLSEMPDFILWCRDELGVQGIQLLNLFRHGNRIDPDVATMWIPKDRLDELDEFVDFAVGFLEHEADDNFTITNSASDLSNIKKYYRDELEPLDGKCYSGWKELYVNADGRAIMCDGKLDFLNGAFGDIRRDTLREMWTGDEITRLRTNVKNCTTPCIQDCYLRRRSDSALRIARGVSRLMYDELRKRLTTPATAEAVPSYTDSELTLQLSDTPELQTSWRTVPWERFTRLTGSSPEPYAALREDPFRHYDFRNRGYLNFDRGFLDMEIMRNVVEDAQRNGVVFGSLVLAWQGEPLLHPQVEEILRWLGEAHRRTPFAQRIVIPTTGTLLNHNYAKITAQEFGDVPFTWLFEVDACDADSFLHTHQEPVWDRVLDNINFLLQVMQESEPAATRVVLQHTATEASAPHAAAFRDFWTGHLAEYGLTAQVATGGRPDGAGHHLWFKRTDPPDLEGIRAARLHHHAAIEALGLTPPSADDGRRMCASYWKTPTISWDGKVVLCTVDTQQTLKIGDAYNGGLTDQWWRSPSMKQVREQVKREDFAGLSACRGCNKPYSPNAPRIAPEESV